VNRNRQRPVLAREPGAQAVGDEDELLAQKGRSAGAYAEAFVEAHPGFPHRRDPEGEFMARGPPGIPAGEPARACRPPARQALRVERKPDEEACLRLIPEEAADGRDGTRGMRHVVVGEQDHLAPGQVEGGIAAAGEAAAREARHRHVRPGRERVEMCRQARIGIGLLYQHQPVEAGRPFPRVRAQRQRPLAMGRDGDGEIRQERVGLWHWRGRGWVRGGRSRYRACGRTQCLHSVLVPRDAPGFSPRGKKTARIPDQHGMQTLISLAISLRALASRPLPFDVLSAAL
jgi:hypothetical protein